MTWGFASQAHKTNYGKQEEKRNSSFSIAFLELLHKTKTDQQIFITPIASPLFKKSQ